MDGFSLRCNNIRCRAILELRAVVTTCSHVFCEGCAQTLQLVNPPSGFCRQCPACEAFLNAPDDAVVTSLNPTEDYKTSLLSGLPPSIILEICQRGMAFWNYQVTQEVVYQETMARGLTEKYQLLSNQLDKVIHDANVEVARLQDKVTRLTVSEEDLRKKNHELMESWREKGRKLAQTQVRENFRRQWNWATELTILIKELYDKLKRKTLMSQVGQGAAENLERALGYNEQQPIIHDLTAPDPGFRQTHLNNRQPRIRRHKTMPEPDFMMTGARIGTINGSGRPESNRSSSGGRRTPVPPPMFGNGPLMYSQGSQNNRSYNSQGGMMPTPSQEHRQRLPPTPRAASGPFGQNSVGMNRGPLNPMNTSAGRVGGGGFAFGKP